MLIDYLVVLARQSGRDYVSVLAFANLSIGERFEDRTACAIFSLKTNECINASDSGADTIVIGNRGWRILFVHPFRSANLIGFDKSARRQSLKIVTGATVAALDDGTEVILRK